MTAVVDKLLAGMRKQFGESAKISVASDLQGTRTFGSSGSLALDFALGNGGWPTNRVVEICGSEHVGKALALSTPLPTPSGWTTMEKVEVGDELFDEQGQPTTVLGVYEVPNPSSAYEVFFSDGSSIRACGEHLWATWDQNQRDRHRKTDRSGESPDDWAASAQVVSTEQIKKTLSRSAGVRRANNHCVFMTRALQLPERDLPIDPWVLGYWLGNGTTSDGGVTCAAKDESHVRSMILGAGYEICAGRHTKGNAVTFVIKGLKVALRDIGVLGDKRIPEEYLRASEGQRLRLAMGLMDSDGHQVKGRGGVEFSSKDLGLITQVSEVFISLSQKPTLHAKEAFIGATSYGTHYRLTFTPNRQLFSVPDRAANYCPLSGAQGLRRQHRTIVEVRQIPAEPMRCVRVDSPHSLYLAGRSMIPTHNTSLALLTMRSFLLAQPDRCALLLDCEHKSDVDWVAAMVGQELVDRVIIMQPLHIEQATDMYTSAVAGDPAKGIPSGLFSIVVLDSIGGAPSMQSVNKSAEIATFGGNAIGVGRFARLAASHSNIYNCLTIGINQVREDMAGLHRVIRPGGLAWKHAIAQSVVLKRGQGKLNETINGEEIQVGQEIKAKIIKNGLAVPGRVASWWFFNMPTTNHMFGIDTLEEIVRLSVLAGVVERRGGWYHHPALSGGRILGKDKLEAAIRDDTALYATLRSEVMARLGDVADQVAPITDPEAPIDDTPMIRPIGDLSE